MTSQLTWGREANGVVVSTVILLDSHASTNPLTMIPHCRMITGQCQREDADRVGDGSAVTCLCQWGCVCFSTLPDYIGCV